MADEERARAAVRGAERFLNAWHGGPAARGRLLEVVEAIDDEEPLDRYGSGDRIEREPVRVADELAVEPVQPLVALLLVDFEVARRVEGDGADAAAVAPDPQGDRR